MTRIPRPPADLSARSKKLWRSILAEFELSDAENELLRCALVSLDRADEAAADIAEHGVTLPDRYGGRKSNPAADVEARNRAAYARFIAQLAVKLDEEQGRPLGRPLRPGPKPSPGRALRSAS